MRELAEKKAGSCAEAAKIGLRARETCAKRLNYFHFRRCANHARDYGTLIREGAPGRRGALRLPHPCAFDSPEAHTLLEARTQSAAAFEVAASCHRSTNAPCQLCASGCSSLLCLLKRPRSDDLGASDCTSGSTQIPCFPASTAATLWALRTISSRALLLAGSRSP